MSKKNQAFSEEEIQALLKEASTSPTEALNAIKEEKKAETPKKQEHPETGKGFAYGVFMASDGQYEVLELSFDMETKTGKIERVVKRYQSKATAGFAAETEIRREILGGKRR